MALSSCKFNPPSLELWIIFFDGTCQTREVLMCFSLCRFSHGCVASLLFEETTFGGTNFMYWSFLFPTKVDQALKLVVNNCCSFSRVLTWGIPWNSNALLLHFFPTCPHLYDIHFLCLNTLYISEPFVILLEFMYPTCVSAYMCFVEEGATYVSLLGSVFLHRFATRLTTISTIWSLWSFWRVEMNRENCTDYLVGMKQIVWRKWWKMQS